MISGLFAIILLSASIKGTMELRKRFGKHFGQSGPKLKTKGKAVGQKYIFWYSYQKRRVSQQ